MKTRFKEMAFLAIMAVFIPMSLSAQRNDAFISNFDEINLNRDSAIQWSIINNGIGQEEPLGSGLLILTAVGAGYAVMRRRRSRKDASRNISTLLVALALVLGMTGCRKNLETITPMSNTNTVHITLNVDNGSKANVVPGDDYATVTFDDGDVIHVGYNNAHVGTLTYSSSTEQFSGDLSISEQVGDQPLHFYFLGNKTPNITETTKYTVDIIDQTSKYPVISYAASIENYPTATGEYRARLFNYCSIMKFTTNDAAALNSSVLCITGMNNTVTVDFNGNSIEYGSKDDGLIKMPTSGSNVRWAIVLPQEELAAGSYGSLYTPNEYFKGSRPSLDEIERNEYLKAGKELKLYDVRFSISSTQKVLFSPGNLVKTDALYEVGSGNETYEFETTPFKTNGGSLGCGDTPTSTSARGYFTWNEIATADETPREFTVNGVSGWKAMTYDDWDYLYFKYGRTMNEGVARFYRVDLGNTGAQVGFLLPPDEAIASDVSDLVADNLTQNVSIDTYLSKGFAFLPAEGYNSYGYMGSVWTNVGGWGYYWITTEDDDYGYLFHFYSDSQGNDDSDNKSYYLSVRLVRDVE